jgi:uncharacterized protein RhaS with RHS repeats
MGNVTTDAYDAADNLVSETDANGHTTQFVYVCRTKFRSHFLPN